MEKLSYPQSMTLAYIPCLTPPVTCWVNSRGSLYFCLFLLQLLEDLFFSRSSPGLTRKRSVWISKQKKRTGHKEGQRRFGKKKRQGMFCHSRRKEDSQNGTAEKKHQRKRDLSLAQLQSWNLKPCWKEGVWAVYSSWTASSGVFYPLFQLSFVL